MEAMCSIYEPKPQYLSLLSDEDMRVDDINVPSDFSSEGDLSITSAEDLEIVNDKFHGYFKVVATNNPSLNLPGFIGSFLEEYVKRYNSKKSLEVEVEYMSNFISSNKGKIEFEELNTNDNTIHIRFKEEKMYSRSEIEKLCRRASYIGHDIAWCDELHKELVDNWIKENLK